MPKAYVALLRAVNVGGNNMVPMKDLAQIFAGAACSEVRTYIQSGNVVFQASAAAVEGLPGRIAAQISKKFGCQTPVILRTADEIAKTIESNPFLQAGAPEQSLHVCFLADRPSEANIARLDPDRSPPDAFRVVNREIYLQMPNGMGRTKLTNAYFDSKLSTTSTVRNWRTVIKLFEMTR